ERDKKRQLRAPLAFGKEELAFGGDRGGSAPELTWATDSPNCNGSVVGYVRDLTSIELNLTGHLHCHSSWASSNCYDAEKEKARRKLYLASVICLVFMTGEVVGGYIAHSLAIMTDAAHLLTDFASMMISLFSLWMSSRPPTKTMNFGWHRAEILGALLMGIALHQSGHGHSHHSHGEGRQNTSVRAAFIHVVGDLLQSIGVLITAYIIYFKPEYKYVDPICTFLFSILVLATTLSILRDVVLVLMEGTPKGVDFNNVKTILLSISGVKALHSLHIWALTVSQPVLSVHIAINADADAQTVLKEASSRLQRAFNFHTTTIQIENYSEDMKDCRECQSPSD
ncbi:hypothetical protein JD844_005406, partial [Phrynosoma platyrhinos]